MSGSATRHQRQIPHGSVADLDAQIAELLALRETIARLYAAASDSEPETCAPNQVCRYL